MANPATMFTISFDAVSSLMVDHLGTKPQAQVPQHLSNFTEVHTVQLLISSEKEFIDQMRVLADCLAPENAEMTKKLRRLVVVHQRFLESLEPVSSPRRKSRFSLSSFIKRRPSDSSASPQLENDENANPSNISEAPQAPPTSSIPNPKPNKAFLLRKSGSVEQLSQQRRRASLPESEEHPGTTLMGEIISEDAEESNGSPSAAAAVLPNITESMAEELEINKEKRLASITDLGVTLPDMSQPRPTAFELKKMGSVEQMSRKKHKSDQPATRMSAAAVEEDEEEEEPEQQPMEIAATQWSDQCEDVVIRPDDVIVVQASPTKPSPKQSSPQTRDAEKISLARSRALCRVFSRKFGAESAALVAFVLELKAVLPGLVGTGLDQRFAEQFKSAQPKSLAEVLVAPVGRLGVYITLLQHLASLTPSEKAKLKYGRTSAAFGQLANKLRFVVDVK